MKDGISYHSKDILFKSLSEWYPNTSLEVYGLKGLPKIKALLANDFPQVRADERRSDTLFLMEDHSILMLEYESNNRFLENHLKYLDYAFRILNRYYEREKVVKNIRIVVIYTSDVTTPKECLDAGDVQLKSHAVLLSEYNGDAILHSIAERVENDLSLSEEEIMKLMIVPLMHSRENRQTMIEKTIELAKRIEDEATQVHVIAGVLVATDKFIDEEYAKKVKEWMKLTKVGRLFEEEKEQAVQEAYNKAFEAAGMLINGMSLEDVARKLGVSTEQVKQWKQRLIIH